jgi:hypothetical protein
MSKRPLRSLTPPVVVGLLAGKLSTSQPGTVCPAAPSFYSGAKLCRKIGPDLIRESLARIRELRTPTLHLRVIDAAIRSRFLVSDWRATIDGLRILESASPFGSDRQRQQLLLVASNPRPMNALRRAVRDETELWPTVMTVLVAEGSSASARLVRRHLQKGAYLGGLDRDAGWWRTRLQSYAKSPVMRALFG